MSGHSKWSQIKHKKAVVDQKKGDAFGKLSHAITLAARDNPDPSSNTRLRAAIDAARRVNMPNLNIERAIARTTTAEGAALQELRLEVVGAEGVVFIVTLITDNRNRTLNEMKQLFSEYHARLAPPNSLLWMFEKVEGGTLVARIPVTPSDTARSSMVRLLEILTAHENVQNTTTNIHPLP